MAINFYKGESMTIIFTAYDNSDPAQLLDISGYTKDVTVFTPYTKPAISLTVTPISNSSFSVTVSAANTAAMNPGDFNIVVKLTDASGGVKIGKSVPCKLIDPNITTAAGSLSIDNGQISVPMTIDVSEINFDMFFGTASIIVDGAVLDTDVTLGGASASDTKVASQLAGKTYTDNKVSTEATARASADTALDTKISNTSTGHDHDGINSKKIDHNNLLNKGTKTHAELEQNLVTIESDLNLKSTKSELYTSYNNLVEQYAHQITVDSYVEDGTGNIISLSNTAHIEIPVQSVGFLFIRILQTPYTNLGVDLGVFKDSNNNFLSNIQYLTKTITTHTQLIWVPEGATKLLFNFQKGYESRVLITNSVENNVNKIKTTLIPISIIDEEDRLFQSELFFDDPSHKIYGYINSSGNITLSSIIGDTIPYKVQAGDKIRVKNWTNVEYPPTSLSQAGVYLDANMRLVETFNTDLDDTEFTVPSTEGIAYVCFLFVQSQAPYLSIKRTSAATGNKILRSSIFPEIDISINGIRSSLVSTISYSKVKERLTDFFTHYFLRDKDINIMLLGDSILARTGNTTLYSVSDQQSRPPMLISRNIASAIWDKVNWQNVIYSRFDKAGIFTETGSTWTSYFGETTIPLCDDSGDRAGETRRFSGTEAASVAFSFPANYRRLNWVYRTIPDGTALTVAVTAGNGIIEVYDRATSAWIEANGYAFTLLYNTTGTGYGTTEYQRRLKFRKVAGQEATAHTITISKAVTATAEALTYWGIEYSKQNYWVNVRNVARGGHDISQLASYIRTEIDNYDIDLILFEIPLLNMKVAANLTPAELWTHATEGVNEFTFGVGANSLKSLSENFTKFKVVAFSPHEQFQWINTDGTWKEKTIAENIYTSPDFFAQFVGRFIGTEVPYIDLYTMWNQEAFKEFGNIYTATFPSSADSLNSYSKDGTHQNDLGTSIYAKYILPLFDWQGGF